MIIIIDIKFKIRHLSFFTDQQLQFTISYIYYIDLTVSVLRAAVFLQNITHIAVCGSIPGILHLLL